MIWLKVHLSWQTWGSCQGETHICWVTENQKVNQETTGETTPDETKGLRISFFDQIYQSRIMAQAQERQGDKTSKRHIAKSWSLGKGNPAVDGHQAAQQLPHLEYGKVAEADPDQYLVVDAVCWVWPESWPCMILGWRHKIMYSGQKVDLYCNAQRKQAAQVSEGVWD